MYLQQAVATHGLNIDTGTFVCQIVFHLDI